MANYLLKEAKKLTFDKNHFELVDTPDLLINLWTYNYYPNHKHSYACRTYSGFCKEI